MLKKYSKPEHWIIPLAVIFLCFIAFASAMLPRDGDYFFMVANGDYILHHGFPKENPFVIHEGLKIVIQQWIPSVFAYWGSGFAWPFVMIESILGLFTLVFVIYKIFSLYQNRRVSFLSASIIVSFMIYLFVGKPMLYSMILLTAQFYVCEKKGSWLWLPLIVMLEANIHASFIAFHFVYLLPYIVPGLTKYLNNTAQYKYILALPFMAIGALLNPYGLDGALYLFNSYGDDLKNIGISELNTISIKTYWGILSILILVVIAAGIYFKHIKPKKPIDSHRFYMFAGSLLLLTLFPQSRNHIFLVIGSIPLLVTLLPKHIKGKTPPTKAMWALALCCVVATIVFAATTESRLPKGVPNGAEYLRGKECTLYTVFDEGSYYEMNGVKVFFDARPELFFKKLNKKANVIDDFKIMVTTRDDKQISEMLDKYNFTHLSVYKKSYLEKYLKKQGYKLVADDEDYRVYEKPSVS